MTTLQHDQTPGPARPQAGAGIDAARRWLRRLGAAAWAALVGQRALLVAAGVIGAVIVLGFLDFLLRFPTWIRAGHFVIGLLALAFVVWRFLLPAWLFRPSLTSLALRVEQQKPELRGLLASGLELDESGDASSLAETDARRRPARSTITDSLAQRVVARAARAFEAARPPTAALLRLGGLVRAAALAVLLVALGAAVWAASPTLAAIGLARTVTPWAGAEWPRRTDVEDVTGLRVHPLGAAAPLRAALVRSPRPAAETDVAVRYRLIRAGQAQASQRALLTYQQKPVAAGDRADAALFEKLVEADADAIEYRFETSDDATEWTRIELVPPPAVAEARAVITPPAYAASLRGDAGYTAHTRDLGPGRDERAVPPRSLAGSAVEMTLTFNKPLEARPDDAAWVRARLGEDLAQAGATVEAAGPASWRVRWTLEKTTRIPVSLMDEHGIASVDESVFRFEAEQDHPPTATVTLPESDRSVLPSAVLAVAGEGRDDVALDSVALERRIARPAGELPSGPGGAVEPDEPVELARAAGEGRLIARAEYELDLSVLGLKPGDEVWLTAVAADVFGASGAVDSSGQARAPTRSPTRRLRIISPDELIEEIRNELANVRQSAIRIHEQQEQVRQRTDRFGSESQARRGQAQVSERIARQQDAVNRLLQRSRDNGLADQRLEDLLRDAGGALREAGESSADASRRLEQAADRGQQQGVEQQGDRSPQQGGQQQSGQQQSGQQQSGQQQSGQQQSGQQQPSQQQSGQQQSGQQQSGQQQSGQQSGQQQSGQQQSGQQQSGQQQQGGQQQPQRPQEGGEQGEQEAMQRLTPEESESVQQAQRDVQERLDDLIAMLDRGEDAWVMRRQLEDAIREQQALREKTAEAGRRTTGRSADELTPQERSELQEIVDRQNDLAAEVQELAEQLAQRAQQLEQKDPAASGGMRQAAQRAQQSQTSQTMRQAAQEASQNRTSSAQQQQAQAQSDLEEMLQDLDRAERAREEALRRVLASLMESLDALIRFQITELSDLDRAEQAGDFTGLDRDMIQLNQNTLGVMDQARSAGREVAPVADIVSRAAAAQGRAVTRLRAFSVDAGAAREEENASLQLLREARARAEEIENELERQQNDRQRRELRKAYRELLAEQVDLREDVGAFADAAELTRRDRAAIRGLGEQQNGLSERLAGIKQKTAELTEARVFDHAHKKLDRLTTEAARTLLDAEPRPALPMQDGAIAILQGLVDALGEDQGDSDQPQQAGGMPGGGGQSQPPPLIPPLAELKLLRQLQIDIAARTRGLGEQADAPPTDVESLGLEQRELNRIGEDLLERLKQQAQGGGVQ